jgi:isopentenyl-diphosphate delta-isomerase
VLVDLDDRPIGTASKVEAHLPPGRRHRAFSLFVHDGGGSLLLQRRAPAKYHFGGLWTNACCSHPRPGEALDAAAARRLREELGLDATGLQAAGRFDYVAHDPASGLVERELDHVLVARATGEVRRDPAEVAEFRWVALDAVADELAARPDTFTPWFAPALAIARDHLRAAGAVDAAGGR